MSQEASTEPTQHTAPIPYWRRARLPGPLSRSRVNNEGSHDPHRCLGLLPQASPATSSRRSRPQAVGDRRAAVCSPGGEQPRDGDDCGRAPRARVSLNTRTATLGVASSCVCEHVREAPFAAAGFPDVSPGPGPFITLAVWRIRRTTSFPGGEASRNSLPGGEPTLSLCFGSCVNLHLPIMRSNFITIITNLSRKLSRIYHEFITMFT